MLAASDVVRPASGVSAAGQGGGAAQVGQQVGRVGGIQAGQGEPHRQRVAVQPVEQARRTSAVPGGAARRGMARAGGRRTGRPRPGSGRRRRSGGPAPSQSSWARLVTSTALAEWSAPSPGSP